MPFEILRVVQAAIGLIPYWCQQTCPRRARSFVVSIDILNLDLDAIDHPGDSRPGSGSLARFARSTFRRFTRP